MRLAPPSRLPVRLLAALLLCASAAQAQMGPEAPPERELYIELDDDAVELLRRAQRYEDIGDWASVVQVYDRILSEPRFAPMLVKGEGGAIIGLRRDVRSRLLALPAAGQRAYDLLREVDARLAWEAGEGGEIEALRAVVARYPASRYANRASARLAAIALTEGQVAEAREAAELALADPKALEASDLERCWRILAICAGLSRRALALEQIKERMANVALPAAAEIGALADRLFAARPLDAASKPPELDAERWTHAFPEHFPGGEEQALCEPLAEGSRLLFHNGSYAYALELSTGKLLWKAPVSDVAEEFHAPTRVCAVAAAARSLVLSPDGESLRGLDLNTGELRWSITQRELRERLEIGAPIRLGERFVSSGPRVYIPATTGGDNHDFLVLCLDAETGALRWTGQACTIRGGNAGAGFTLHLAGQRLFALTGDGALACFQALDGGFLWLQEYGGGGNPRRPGVCELTGGELFLAPPEAQGAFVIDPDSGQLLRPFANRDGDLLIGNLRGEWLRLTRRGQLRLGERALGQLPRGARLLQRPWLRGKLACFVFEDGVLLTDVSSGETRRLEGWGRLEAKARVLPIPGGLIALSPKGCAAFGGADGLGAPDWAAAPPEDPAFFVPRLGSESWAEREAASAALLAHGPDATPLLQALLDSPDAEAASRARELLYEFSRGERRERWAALIKPEWEQAVPALLDRLTHRNPRIRLEAVERLGEIPSKETLALMGDLLSDRSPGIAFTAARLLYLRGDRRGFDLFRELLATGPQPRQERLLETLDARKTRRSEERLLDLPLAVAALSSSFPEIRARAALLAVELGDRKAIDEVAGVLADPIEDVRVAAINALGALNLNRCGPLLAPLCEDDNAFVRDAAVKAISRLETQVAAAALCKACLDKSPLIARAAADALEAMAKSPDSPKLIPDEGIEAALAAKDAEVRATLVRVCETRVRKPMKLYVMLGLDPDPRIAQPALEKIFQRAGPADLPLLAPLVKVEDPEALFIIVQIFGRLGETVQPPIQARTLLADPHLIELLRCPDAQTREKAAEYLRARAHPRTVWLLLRERVRAVANAEVARTSLEEAKAALTALRAAKGVPEPAPPPEDPELEVAVIDPELGAAEQALAAAERRATAAAEREQLLVTLVQNMSAETEAPGCVLALSDPEEEVRALAVKDLSLMLSTTRDFDPKADAAARAPAVAAWRAWYFDYKSDGAKLEALREALAGDTPQGRIDAAKTIALSWDAAAAREVLAALAKESVPWVAASLNKVLELMTLRASGLPEKPDAAAIKAAAAFWERLIPLLDAPPGEGPAVADPPAPK